MSGIFHIITFGCQMNVGDSEWIAAMSRSAGMAEGSVEDADVILINTCSVREKPEQKVRTAIGNIEKICRKDCFIGVLGCVAQQLGVKLYDFSPKIRLIAGADGIPHIPGAIDRLLRNECDRLDFLDFSREFPERPLGGEKSPTGSAYVNIMQGCDNFCAYCIVPFTRGRQKSRQSKAILAECEARIAAGARDITLLGQNVNAYGLDKKGGEIAFAELLEKAAQLPGLERLHFVTPHPADMDDRTVAAFRDLPNLCPRLHLPLQSGSDNVLKRMRRRYTAGDFSRLVGKLREAREDIALSTDLITGFPGETEQDFEDTLKMMKFCGFMSSYSFCYSDRPGTRASLMPDKIPAAIMDARLSRLQEVQEELGHAWLAGRVGKTVKILIDGKSPRQNANGDSWQGRDEWGAIAHVCLPGDNHMGQMINVKITAAKRHSLMAEPL